MADILDMLREENESTRGLEDLNFDGEDAYPEIPTLDGEESDGSNPSVEEASGGYMVDKDGCGAVLVEEDGEDMLSENGAGNEQGEDNRIKIDSFQDMKHMKLVEFSPHEIIRYDFGSLDVVFQFYSWYARMNGFAARRGKTIKSKKTGRILQQNFFCYREGKRQPCGEPEEEGQREPKAQTRCSCKAEFRAHVDINSGRWYCSYFSDMHSHELLDPKFCAMLPAHRKMNMGDVNQMNNMLKVGIGAPQIFGSFANQSGGYEKVSFRKKDIYNQITQQRRQKHSDATAAVKYLRELGVNDPDMFTRHTMTEDGRLEHLFWCDGIMQVNYKVFGNVVAFDATYGKNKYRLPLVIFSGVNHHNQTTIFASAVAANETEETYVWLLVQFLEAMKGKMPASVIIQMETLQ